MLKIDFNAFFIAMQSSKIGCLAARQRRAPTARDITCTKGFEFDHLGAVVGQHGGTKRAGQGVSEIENLDAFEG